MNNHSNTKNNICGLPGLIMEATETSGQHGFTATGIETSTQTIYPLFSSEYEKDEQA